MQERAEEFVPIDLTLRFVLFGLECALGVGLSAPEAERAFREAAEDRVSAREYVFHESGKLLITGRVDEYEPGVMRLHVEGLRRCWGGSSNRRGIMWAGCEGPRPEVAPPGGIVRPCA
jgi:hypothetical protein